MKISKGKSKRMCRLLVIESKITNICPCRTDLHTLAESAISDEDGDKEEQEKKTPTRSLSFAYQIQNRIEIYYYASGTSKNARLLVIETNNTLTYPFHVFRRREKQQ